MRAEITYILDRDSYADLQVAAIEAARARKVQARREEIDRLIAAVHAERMARVEQIARDMVCRPSRDLGCGGGG